MNGVYDLTREIEYSILIGSKIMPEYPVRSLAQAFFEVEKPLGIADSAYHSVSVRPDQYCRHHFIDGIDCKKALGVSYTGLSNKSGDWMTIRAKFANGSPVDGTGNPINLPVKLYITPNSDNILEVRDSGASVYD